MKTRTTFDSVLNPVPGDPSKGAGYWIHLGTVELIRSRCGDAPRALAVFFALNLLATDFHSDAFPVTLAHIGKLSGLNVRWVEKSLQQLKEIQVVKAEAVVGASAVEGLVKITILSEVRFT